MKINIQNVFHVTGKGTYRSVLLAVFFVSLCAVWSLHLIKPLFDQDFYWHLKTGFWMWDHRELPTIDPFSIKPLRADSHRTQFILTSYWFFQLLLCAFYKMGGFGGIILFRFILSALFIAIFYRFSITKNTIVALGAGIGITQILSLYFPERPQFISFVCSALLLSLVFARLRERKGGLLSLLVPLSLTMLVWANTHGGFILGQILLVYILLAEAVKFVHPALLPISGKEYMNLAISICSAVLVSFINPNHIHSIEMVLPSGEANSFIYTSILEFSNLYEYYKSEGGHEPIIAVCTYIFILFIFLSSRDRTNITWIGLLGLLGYMGLRHIRYYPLFLVCATLFAIQYFDTRTIGKISRIALCIFFVIVVGLSLSKTPRNLKNISTYGWVPASYYPVKVCDFVNANGMNGNVFTTMDWGGYVIWRLAPQQKVFFDGRQLDPARSWEYFYGLDNWKMLFDKYDIRVAIVPILEEPFKPYALTKALEMDSAWRLVRSANNGAVFIRN